MFFQDIIHIGRGDMDIKGLVGHHFYNGALFTETETTGHHNLDLILHAVFGNELDKFFADILTL